MFSRSPILLAVICCQLLARTFALAAPLNPGAPTGTPLRPRQLERLILPEVKFRDADLSGALIYLQRKAEQQSQGKVRVPFVVELPADFQSRYELTLHLQNIPFSEALRYLGEQAGVEFAVENDELIVRRLGTASAASANKESKPANRAPRANKDKGWSGRLAKGPEAVKGGDNIHRATSGEVQREKSGYVPRRSLSGWNTERFPKRTIDINCIRPSACPGDCGCQSGICTCRQWESEIMKPSRP